MSYSPLVLLCRAHHLPEPTPEHRFCVRKWRLDWVWIDKLVALEVEGGVWTQGRHTRGKGFVADMEKYNAAQLLGWIVLRATPQQIQSGQILDTLKEALS